MAKSKITSRICFLERIAKALVNIAKIFLILVFITQYLNEITCITFRIGDRLSSENHVRIALESFAVYKITC